MTYKALTKIRKKHKTWQRYMETQNGQDYNEYARARNQARNEVRKSIRDYERKIGKEIKKSPKQFWRYVRNKMNTTNAIPQLEKSDGDLTLNDKEKANTMNNFFASVFTPEVGEPPELHTRNYDTPLSDVNIDKKDVTIRLSKIDPNKSPGPDGQHPRVYKELANVIDQPLCQIFRKSLQQGIVPSDWKNAQVTPIHKKGPRNQPNNYRPISLTSIACKIMESIVREHILTHMLDNDLFVEEQHGFLPGRSCVTQLLEVLDDWFLHYDNSIPIDVIYLDMARPLILFPIKDY